MSDPEERRVRRLLPRLTTGLDLAGLTVYTEAASGPYLWPPLLAALAGARVTALAADTRFHRAGDAAAATAAAAQRLGVPTSSPTAAPCGRSTRPPWPP
jgi:hypothetical protein